MRLRRLLAPIVASTALLAAAVLTGCDDIEKNPQSIYVVGDSIVASIFWWHDAEVAAAISPSTSYTVMFDAASGQTAADHVDQVTAYGAVNRPERLVVELGTNDAIREHWGSEQVAAYQALLDGTAARTCVVAIVPAAGPSYTNETDRENLERAATDIRAMVSALPHHQLLEMADFIATNPSAMGPDGIHLTMVDDQPTATDAARAAYLAWLAPAVKACQPGTS